MEGLARVLGGAGEGIGEVVGRPGLVAVHAHGPVALVVAHAGVEGTVDGDLLVIGTEAVPVRVCVGEEPTLRGKGG